MIRKSPKRTKSAARPERFQPFVRCEGMPLFRIYYFRHNVLEQTEEAEVRDVLEAIEHASGKDLEVHAEIWSEKGKVGVIGASPIHRQLNVSRPPL